MWTDPSDDQSHIIRGEEDSSIQSGYLSRFFRNLANWFLFFWQSLTRMITTRPMMMMLSSSSVVDHHRTALSALDQLEEYRIQDKTRSYDQASVEMTSGEGEHFKTTGLIGTSFPPLISHTQFQHRCGYQNSFSGSIQTHPLTIKHHSESDLTGILIMSQREPANTTIDEDTTQNQDSLPALDSIDMPAEEALFAMDEDEPQNAFTLVSDNDTCVITDNDVNKFLSGLQEEKTFDKSSWDNEEDDESSDESSSSRSSTSSPMEIKTVTPKFECSLSTIQASPAISSLLDTPSIHVEDHKEELTPLQKKILDRHPPTKQSTQPPKKFLEVKDNKGGKLRRATSLKINTSPDEKSDTQKKIVRFADVLGLDLESTKTFKHGIPTVPKSAYLYLRDVELSDTESETSSRGIGSGCSTFSSSRPTRSITPPTGFTRSPEQIVAKSGLAPQFTQPGAKEDFTSIVKFQNVCLECAYVSVNGSTLSGVVAVNNMSFEKKVTVRYTIDDWLSFTDCEATYSSSCPTSGADKFSFDIRFSFPISLSQRIQFCIKYNTTHGEFWDNNFGANYIFRSLTKYDLASSSQHRQPSQMIVSQSPSCSEDPWHHFI